MVKRFSINKAYIFKIYVGKIHACEGESEQERLDYSQESKALSSQPTQMMVLVRYSK